MKPTSFHEREINREVCVGKFAKSIFSGKIPWQLRGTISKLSFIHVNGFRWKFPSTHFNFSFWKSPSLNVLFLMFVILRKRFTWIIKEFLKKFLFKWPHTFVRWYKFRRSLRRTSQINLPGELLKSVAGTLISNWPISWKLFMGVLKASIMRLVSKT